VKIINSLSQALNVLAIGVLVVMMLLTVADVGMRYVLRHPIVGSVELTEFMMVFVVFLGLAWCAVRGRHVKVDLFLSRFSPRVQAIVDSITYIGSLGIFVIIAWRSLLESFSVWQMHLVSTILKVPMFPFYWVLTLGCAVLCLVMITNIIQYVAKAVKG